MPLKRAVHLPIEVDVIQVGQSPRNVTAVFHRSRVQKQRSGKLDYIYLVDADEVAYPGDWILRHSDGALQVVPDEVFVKNYELS